MSFLLRNRSSTGVGRVLPRGPAPRGDGTIRPRSTSRGADPPNSSSAPGMQSGNQMMLQRNVHPSQKQTISQKGSKLHDLEQESQGMISMSEVLADLRVLEQQQRDAQKKLTSARVTKQQRVEHHAALESKLEHLKYSNGEFRAQLRQSRESLSSSTRALGSRRLATEKASGDIRGFEKKLNRGLQSARVNAACRRKIDSLFILVENKLTQLGRLKIEAKARLEKLEASLKEGKHKEETLRAAVQQEVSKAHQGANDLAAIRAQNIEAEKELLMAQNMEESTRTRVKALVCQIDSEKLQIEEQTTNLSTQITIEANKVASFEAQSEGLKNCLADRLQALNEEELNQNTSSEQKIAEGHFEIETVEASLQASRTKARNVQDSNSILQDEIEKMQAALDNNAEIVACNRRACQETTNSAEEMMASETERRKELSSFQLELDLEREAVDKLEKSSQEMKETRSMTSARHSHAIIACDEALEQARQGIDEARRAKESADTEHASGAVKWETERVDIFAELERAKTKSKAAEGTLSELDMLSKKVEEGFKAKLHQELMMIEERKAEEKEEIKAKVALILHKRPKLRSVISEFVHDSTVSKRDHIMQALGPIKSELESKIRAAKEMTKQKKQARIESRRRAEAAVRAVRQNDEARREQRERIIVERKRQEAEESLHVYSNTATDDDSEPPKIVPTVRHKRPHNTQSSKARQGAEFFFPQSQDSLSDEETPTEPKSLLHSFSTVRSASQKTSIELNLSADKRVHWKDGGSDVSDGTAIEERKEGKLEKNVKQSGTSSCVSITVGNELPREEEEKSKEHSPVVKNAPTLQQSGASSFGPVVLTKDDTAEDFVEEKRINDSEKGKPARKARQYGKSKRGLEAISRSRQCQKRSSGDTEAKPSLHHSFDKRSEPFIVVDLGGNNSLRRKEKNERNISILSEGKANHSSASKKIQKGESLDTKKPKVVEVLRARVDIEASKQRNRGGLLLQSAASTAKSSYSKDRDHKKADCIFLDSGKSQEDSHEQIRCKKRDEGFSSVDGKNPNKSEQQKNVLSRQRSQSLTCRTHGPPNISNEVACTKARSRTVASVSPRELSHSKSEGGSRVETSRKSTSKSVASGSSRISSPKKTDATTKKRKMQEQSLLPTQPSGLSSAEGAPKSRRRKKSSSSHRSSIGMADDAYSFAF